MPWLTLLVLACTGCHTDEAPAGPRIEAVYPGFTVIDRMQRRIKNAALEGFNTAAVGMAASEDGMALDVLGKRGMWRTTWTTGKVMSITGGFVVIGQQPGSTTWSEVEFALHSSRDGGVTWTRTPLEAARGSTEGNLNGLFRVGDTLYSVLWGEARRELVRIDPDAGRWDVADFRTPEGTRVAFGVYDASFHHGVITWPLFVTDGSYFYMSTLNLWTGEFRQFGIHRPPCTPLSAMAEGSYLVWSVDGMMTRATSAGTIQGVCLRAPDELCSFTWSPTPDDPGRQLAIRHCAPAADLWNPEDDSVDGATLRVLPRGSLPSPAGLLIAADLEYTSESESSAWYRAVAFRLADGALIPIDLGPGRFLIDDSLDMRAFETNTLRVVPSCNIYDGDGCIGVDDPVGEQARARQYRWDETLGTLAPVTLAPPPCREGPGCPRLPHRITAVPNDPGRYLVAYHFSSGLEGVVERAFAVGLVTDSRHQPRPELTPASPLEHRCWAELRCVGAMGPGPDEAAALVRACIERWLVVGGLPDTRWAAFAAADPLDCDALERTDPVGFAWPWTCVPGQCDPTGEIPCGRQRSCDEVNGGRCAVIGGVAGCYAEACAHVGSEAAACDAAGRWVDCGSGLVDDCASRGLACGAEVGCGVPDGACADSSGARRCDGSHLATCIGTGLSWRTDCARHAATCEVDDEGYAGCSAPWIPPPYSHCDGHRLIRGEHFVDCAAIGMNCWEHPGGLGGQCVGP